MTTERAYFGYENRLVERLRLLEGCAFRDPEIFRNAADEIERLTALNAELVAALENIATTGCETGHPMCYDIARAALAKVKEGK